MGQTRTGESHRGLIKDTEEATVQNQHDTAAENAVYGGLGFIVLFTDYVSELSFNQEPKGFLPCKTLMRLYRPVGAVRRWLGHDMIVNLIRSSKDDIVEQYGNDAAVDFESE